VQVANEQYVDVPWRIGERAVQVRAATAVEVGGPGVPQAGAGQRVHPDRIGQDQFGAAQVAAVGVPVEVPVRRPGDQRHRRRPQAGRDGVVGKMEDDEVRLPAGRQAGLDRFPGIVPAEGQVGGTLGVEGEAAAGRAGTGQVIAREVSGDGAEQVAPGHERSLGGRAGSGYFRKQTR
jgi:hypothetical protein